MGRPDYIFGRFRETARCRDAQHGDGVCCAFAPQLVVLVLVLSVVVTLVLRLFYISQPIVVKLCIQIGDNIIHNRTISDFQVKS